MRATTGNFPVLHIRNKYSGAVEIRSRSKSCCCGICSKNMFFVDAICLLYHSLTCVLLFVSLHLLKVALDPTSFRSFFPLSKFTATLGLLCSFLQFPFYVILLPVPSQYFEVHIAFLLNGTLGHFYLLLFSLCLVFGLLPFAFAVLCLFGHVCLGPSFRGFPVS